MYTMNKNVRSTDTRYLKNFQYYEGDFIGTSLEVYGEYQQPEIDFLSQTITGQVVWDVGANIGVHTTAFASLAKEVHSFEPFPAHFRLLENNTCDLDNVFVYNLAVGNSDQQLMMEDLEELQESRNYGTVRVSDTGTIPVTQVRLDDMELPPPRLIKIDVEGYEYQALLGMEKIITEFQPHLNIEAMENVNDIVDFFEGMPYNLYWTCCRNYNENNYKQNKQNIFASPNSAIFSIFATTEQIDGLPKVNGPEDTWEKLLERVNK